jgi:hypothetical protein
MPSLAEAAALYHQGEVADAYTMLHLGGDDYGLEGTYYTALCAAKLGRKGEAVQGSGEGSGNGGELLSSAAVQDASLSFLYRRRAGWKTVRPSGGYPGRGDGILTGPSGPGLYPLGPGEYSGNPSRNSMQPLRRIRITLPPSIPWATSWRTRESCWNAP